MALAEDRVTLPSGAGLLLARYYDGRLVVNPVLDGKRYRWRDAGAVALRDMTKAESTQFSFSGKHLMLSFIGCKVDLNDVAIIKRDMIRAIEAVGASIIAEAESKFAPHGVSIVFLLAESHASIHTYPEHNACFLDIFTCGRTLRIEEFGQTLQRLWLPEEVSTELRER